MLKVHRIIANRDTGRVERNAKEALNVAREILSDLVAQKKPMPQCTHCKESVSQPCWYCVDCTGERFICDDCEYKCLAFDDIHTKKHTLVRVVEKVAEAAVSTEERLRMVEGQLGTVQERLGKMEKLLLKLLEKGPEPSTGELIKSDVQEIVEEEEHTESNNPEVNDKNQEAIPNSTVDE